MGDVAYSQVQEVFDAVDSFSEEKLITVVKSNRAVLAALDAWAEAQGRRWSNNPFDINQPQSVLRRLVNLTKRITAPKDQELRFDILLTAMRALSRFDSKITAPLFSVLLSPLSSRRQKWQALRIWWHHEPSMRWD